MKIAVVIPVLDEVELIPGAIASAMPQRVVPSEPASPEQGLVASGPPPGSAGFGTGPGPEIVVVDAGSQDGSAERASQSGARVLTAERGRARQLEAGWRASSGDAIVFLHADTRLEVGWEGALRQALSDPSVVGGAFRLRFDAPGLCFRLVEWVVRLRVAVFSLPYGDQGIFVRRSVLEGMGGVPEVEIMEDLDLVRAMNRRGKVAALKPAATTSARRYRERGLLRTLLLNALALGGWRLGIDRMRIVRWVGR